MISSVEPPAKLGRATLGSVVLHVAAALCIPALAWTASSAPPVETISFTRVSHIALEPPRRRPQPRPAAPHHSEVSKVTLVAEHVELARSAPRHSASPPPAVASAISSAPTVASRTTIGNGQAQTDAAPQPTATPAERSVASVGGHNAGGYLPFGAEQPDPVLNPGVMRALEALGVHVTVLVTVDEDGRTKAVAFDPAVDPQTQAHIESLLADASWDPAVCGGGTACEGHATLKL